MNISKNEDYLFALELIEASKFEKALEILNKLSVILINFPDIFTKIALINWKFAQYDKAVIYCDKAISLGSSNPETYKYKGNALRYLGKNEEALNCYDKALDMFPCDEDAYNNKGILLSDLGKNEEALFCYEKAIQLNSLYVDAYLNKGNALRCLGKNEEALNCYEKTIEIFPNDDIAYNNKGILLSDLGKNEEALNCYEKAIQLNSLYVDAYLNKGNALISLGKNEEALYCYDKLIEIYPNNDIAYNNKGILLSDLGKNEEALYCYDKAILLNSFNADAYLNKGNALRDLGKNEEALICFDKTIEIFPNDDIAYNNKGILLSNLGKNEEALYCYEKAIELQPSPLYYANLGLFLKRMNNIDESLVNLYKANKLINSENFIKEDFKLSDLNVEFIKESLKNIIELENISKEINKKLETLETETNSTDVKILRRKYNEIKEINVILDPEKNKDQQFEINLKVLGDLKNLQNQINLMTENSENFEKEIDNLDIILNLNVDKSFKKIVKENLDLNAQELIYLKEYYKGMSNTFSNIYSTSQIVISGQVKLEVSIMAENTFSYLATFVPFFGDKISETFISVDSFLKSDKMINYANDFLRQFKNYSDLDEKVGKLLSVIFKNKLYRQILLEINEKSIILNEKAKFEKLKKNFNELNNWVSKKLYSKLYKTSFEKRGNQDANTIIKYIVKKKGKINENFENICSQYLFDYFIMKKREKLELEKNFPKGPCSRCNIF